MPLNAKEKELARQRAVVFENYLGARSTELFPSVLSPNNESFAPKTSLKNDDESSLDDNSTFPLLLSLQRSNRELTFSLRPRVGQPFDRSEHKWDGRHHVSVSRGNTQLHQMHRDFFDRPRAFDMCTKPRSIKLEKCVKETIDKNTSSKEMTEYIDVRPKYQKQKYMRGDIFSSPVLVNAPSFSKSYPFVKSSPVLSPVAVSGKSRH